jgi:hypothetical protein
MASIRKLKKQSKRVQQLGGVTPAGKAREARRLAELISHYKGRES